MSSSRIEIPTLEDDGLLTPEVGDWAEEKYRLIKLYAGLFTTSMRKKWDELVYLDLFAGAGRSAVRGTERIIPASPMLALGLEHPFNRYVFCEADEEKIDVLETRVRRDFPHTDAHFVRGDVNDNVAAVFAALPAPRHGHGVLAFCFVDPYRLSDLRFRTISSLSQRFMDFLVLIPSGFDATRNESRYLSEESHTVDDFLGTSEWRSEWEAAKSAGKTFERFVTDAFGEAMKGLGYLYEEIESAHLVRLTEKRTPLYRLALFSRHPLGKKFWQEARKYASDQRELPF